MFIGLWLNAGDGDSQLLPAGFDGAHGLQGWLAGRRACRKALEALVAWVAALQAQRGGQEAAEGTASGRAGQEALVRKQASTRNSCQPSLCLTDCRGVQLLCVRSSVLWRQPRQLAGAGGLGAAQRQAVHSKRWARLRRQPHQVWGVPNSRAWECSLCAAREALSQCPDLPCTREDRYHMVARRPMRRPIAPARLPGPGMPQPRGHVKAAPGTGAGGRRHWPCSRMRSPSPATMSGVSWAR